MDRPPNVRFVGNASAESREKVTNELRSYLFEHFTALSPEQKALFEKLEYPKTQKEVALIDFANRETSRLMSEAGIEPYDVPTANFHLVPSEFYRKEVGAGSDAAASVLDQWILFNAERVRTKTVLFGFTSFHELLHLKAHPTIEVREEGEDKIRQSVYRFGVSVRALQQHSRNKAWHEHFRGLHEAIVAQAEVEYLPRLLQIPDLADEKAWLESDEADQLRKKVSEERRIPQDDIVLGPKGSDIWDTLSYPKHRQALRYVCEQIAQTLPENYPRADDVFKVFLNANFTGKLLPIARLVEQTFGEGTFRLLGNMKADDESAVLHLESLRKARARVLRQNKRN
jgi:hypothetical protein